jgi:hypothetical protein
VQHPTERELAMFVLPPAENMPLISSSEKPAA